MEQNTDDLCEMIAEKYYDQMYYYCFQHLSFDEQAALDCTQEIFLIMTKKKKQLNLSGNIRVWLYKTADKVMRNYIRREKKYRTNIPLDEVNIPDDGGISSVISDSQLDCLTDEERELFIAYCSAEYGTREALANEYGMTLATLYKKIERLKKKIISSM